MLKSNDSVEMQNLVNALSLDISQLKEASQ